MPSTSRAESQRRTRDALLETAHDMFLRDGYAATSLDRVADTAGYSKGAVYSNFRGKEELCLAVLDEMYARDIVALIEAVTDSASLGERIDALAGWAHRTLGAEGRTVLGVEFALHVRHSPELRANLAALDRRMAGAIAELLARQRDEFGIELALPPERAASALLDLGIGIAVHRVADPDVTVLGLVETVRALLGMPRPGSERPESLS